MIPDQRKPPWLTLYRAPVSALYPLVSPTPHGLRCLSTPSTLALCIPILLSYANDSRSRAHRRRAVRFTSDENQPRRISGLQILRQSEFAFLRREKEDEAFKKFARIQAKRKGPPSIYSFQCPLSSIALAGRSSRIEPEIRNDFENLDGGEIARSILNGQMANTFRRKIIPFRPLEAKI